MKKYIIFVLFFSLLACSKPGEHTLLEFDLNSNWEIKHTLSNTTEYTIRFDLDPAYFLRDSIFLRSDRVLSNVSIYLNDTLLSKPIQGTCVFQITCKKYLRNKSNLLKVVFESNTDVSAGIIESFKIIAWSKVKFDNVSLNLVSLQKDQAQYNAEITIESAVETTIDIDILVQQKDVIKIRDLSIKQGENKQLVSFSIHNPKLWWVNGYGEPDIYDIFIRLSLKKNIIHELHNKVAIRKVDRIKIPNSAIKKTMIGLNGMPIKLKGVCFMPPVQNIPDSVEHLYKRIVASARMANVNVIYVENPDFYGKKLFSILCMENGLLFTDTSFLLSKNDAEWFGYPSYPSPETMDLCPDPKNGHNINAINQQNLIRKNLPSALSDSIYLNYEPSLELKRFVYYSQLLQGEKIKYEIEHFRIQNTDKCGIIYNHINNYYSVLSESIQDCMGNWKPAQYSLKNAFAACIVVPVISNNKVNIFAVNDQKKEVNGILLCKLIDFYGKDFFVKQIPIVIQPDISQNLLTIGLDQLVNRTTRNKLCLIIQVNQPGQTVTQNILYFDKPVNIQLPYARIKASVNTVARSYNLVLKSNVLVKSVVLEISNQEAMFSDNNFDLLPGKRTKISIDYKGTRQELMRTLRINALNSFEIDYK
jgi:hypothetical protein